MSLLLLLDAPPVVIPVNPAIELDTFLVSVSFPEASISADRGVTSIAAADPSTSVTAADPSTSVVAV
jgi:hypothetical protein